MVYVLPDPVCPYAKQVACMQMRSICQQLLHMLGLIKACCGVLKTTHRAAHLNDCNLAPVAPLRLAKLLLMHASP